MSSQKNQQLKRTLSLKDAISIVSGSMIGCGIFIVSSEIARQTQSAWLLLLVWVIAGIVTVCGALSYGELASSMANEGGQYFYLKKIFNEKIAFLYGWTLFLVIQTGTIAAVSVAFAKFTGVIFPFIGTNVEVLNCGFFCITAQKICAILCVLVITFINSRGIKQGVLTQNIFTVTKILSLIAIIFCGLFLGLNFEIIAQNFSAENNQIIPNFDTLRILAVAIVGALFASITWNNITFITSEIKKPEKNIPKALISGTLLVIGLYLLTNLIYLGTLPTEALANAPDDIVAIALMNKIFNSSTANISVSFIIAISAFGCANGMILTGSRVYYKMAKDRLFFRSLAVINRKTKVPTNSLWLQSLWICILILWGNYFQLLDFVIYASLIFYILTTFGIFIYRKKFHNPQSGRLVRPFHLHSKTELHLPAPTHTFKVHSAIPIIFITIASFIVICLTIYKPAYTLPGLLITLSGMPVYHFWDKNRKRVFN